MTLNEVKNRLKKAMMKIEVDGELETAFITLSYTASQTKLMPLDLHEEYVEIIQLVKLAEQLKNNKDILYELSL